MNQPAHVLVFTRASYAFYLCNGHDVGIDVGFCSTPSHTDELTRSALDAIHLRFVPRDALSNTAVHEVMPCSSQYLLISHSFLRILTVCSVCLCVCVRARVYRASNSIPLYTHIKYSARKSASTAISPRKLISHIRRTAYYQPSHLHTSHNKAMSMLHGAHLLVILSTNQTQTHEWGSRGNRAGRVAIKKKDSKYNPINNFRVFSF